MKPKKHLILLLFTSLLYSLSINALNGVNGNGSLSEEFDSLISHHGPSQIIIDERVLLKKYLSELDRRGSYNIHVEMAKLKFKKDIFNEKNIRWWTSHYKNARTEEQEKKIKEYWDLYYQGQNYAKKIIDSSGAGTNYCQLLTRVKSALRDEQKVHKTPFEKEPFKRGIKVAFPQCFIKDTQKSLRRLYQRVTNLNDRIFEIRTKMDLISPDEKMAWKVFKKFKLKLQALVSNELIDYQDILSQSLKISDNHYQQILKSSKAISYKIGCSDLKGPFGNYSSCAITKLPALKKLNLYDTSKVLLNNMPTGNFQERVITQGLERATRLYLSTYKHEDPLVLNQLRRMKTSATEMNNALTRRVHNLKFEFKEKLNHVVKEFRFTYDDFWSDFLSPKLREQIIQLFFDLQKSIETYSRFELGMTHQEDILNTILSSYESSLNMAAGLKLNITLPKEEIFVKIGDRERNKVHLKNVYLTDIPTGYLLGKTKEDVQDWVQFLKIKDGGY